MFPIGTTRLQYSNCTDHLRQVSAALREFQASRQSSGFFAKFDRQTSATIAIPLVRAVISFEWRFDSLPDRRTLISQRITLEGENAETYRSQVASTFAANLPNGMAKIARAMAEAYAHQADLDE